MVTRSSPNQIITFIPHQLLSDVVWVPYKFASVFSAKFSGIKPAIRLRPTMSSTEGDIFSAGSHCRFGGLAGPTGQERSVCFV